MISKDIKVVIFDFGNVIINIDVPKTYKTFAQLCGKSEEKIKSIFDENMLFKRYETGLFEEDEFRDAVRQILGFPLNDYEIDQAWNALLLDIPAERIQFLHKLREIIPIYLLSNTNDLHIRAANQILYKSVGVRDVRNLFTKAYMSYEIGLWKPDTAIYTYVLHDLGLKPNEVLFLDDNEANIESAKQFGWETIFIQPDTFTMLDVDFSPILKT
jgi:putative hydrolase of the HAD superfamily